MIRQVRAVWDAPPASPPPPRRVWRDVALVIALPIIIVIEAATRSSLPFVALSAAALIAIVPLVLIRRTRPLAALLTSMAVTTAVSLVTGPDTTLYSTAFISIYAYAVFRWGSGRSMTIGLAALVASYAASTLVPPTTLEDVVGGAVVIVGIVTLALALRFRAKAQQRDVERMRLLERERLARDLHDSVAHHVSAITITAQAGLATAGTQRDSAIDALTVIEREASLTLADMRRMVAVLRIDDPLEQPENLRIADLPALLWRDHRATPVTIEIEGETDALPAPVSATVFRLVQESVTNARRHARGATRIDVRIVHDDAGVHLEVVDDGAGRAGARDDAASHGFGITGMRERAAQFGGSLTAGRDSAGGWRVSASLPRSGWPA